MESSEFKTATSSDAVQRGMPGWKRSLQSYKTTTGIGAVMILSSIMLTLMNFPFAFDVTALAWGSIIIALGQFFRHKENVLSIQLRKEYLRLEHEADLRNYKLTMMQKVLSLLPSSDITFENIESLLKEESSNIKTKKQIENNPGSEGLEVGTSLIHREKH
ncbi:MAG TPA: hypothetical protein VKA08_18640 [Balneolales bacterium]|nr:hypothetical protein [Balneolales bacterium]